MTCDGMDWDGWFGLALDTKYVERMFMIIFGSGNDVMLARST